MTTTQQSQSAQAQSGQSRPKQSQPTQSQPGQSQPGQTEQQGEDRQQAAHKAFRKEDMPDPDEEPLTEYPGAQDNAADAGEDPEKKIQIDDNPEETKKKIPYMNE